MIGYDSTFGSEKPTWQFSWDWDLMLCPHSKLVKISVLSFCAVRDAEQEGYDLACAAFEIHNVLGYSMAEEIKGDIYEGLMAKSGRKEH